MEDVVIRDATVADTGEGTQRCRVNLTESVSLDIRRMARLRTCSYGARTWLWTSGDP